MNISNLSATHPTTKILSWGNSDHPILLCLHGLGGTALSFSELASTLSDHFCVVAPYIPGSGGTPSFENTDGYEMANLVYWLSAVIKSFNQPVFLLSHSWGAHMGIHLQATNPELVTKHLMLDGGYYLRMPPNHTLSVLEEEIKEQILSDQEYTFSNVTDYLEAEKGDVNHWNDHLKNAALDRMIERNGQLHWHLTADVTERAFKGIFNASPDKIYPQLETLKLGEKNLLLRATEPASKIERLDYAKIFTERTLIPVEPISNAGHSIHLDQPDIVAQRAITFFQ